MDSVRNYRGVDLISLADIPLTPQGPSPGVLLNFFGSTTYSHVQFNISRGKDPQFDIKNKRLQKVGLSWIDLRRIMKDAMLSPVNDPQLLKEIKALSLPYIPVRSGRLADTFFNTMEIRRKSWYSTQYVFALGTEWSPLRPRPITGNVSKLGQGYGEHYIPSHDIPNRHLLYGTAGGNALYILDDPMAINSPDLKIKAIAKDILENEFLNTWNNTIITLHI